jgi:hypothetical protein
VGDVCCCASAGVADSSVTASEAASRAREKNALLPRDPELGFMTRPPLD